MTSTDAPIPAFDTLPKIITQAAAVYGDRIAIRSAEASGLETITYSELEARSAALRDRIAPELARGDFVLLSGRNSIAWVAALLAITRAGAVPVPIDPEIDAAALALIGDELKPAAVLADRSMLERTEGTGRLQLALEDSAVTGDGGDAPSPDAQFDPGELALMVYTAGTTGRPKGVMLSHRNLTSNIAAIMDAAGLTEDDSVFVVLPLYHAFPLTGGCLGPIGAGVTIELEDRPSRVATRLRQARPTLVIGVPALFETVLRSIRHQARGGMRGRYLRAAQAVNRLLIRTIGVNAGRLLFRPVHAAMGGRLRYAVAGGAPLTPEVARDAFVIGLPLMQGYGMSEASPVVAVQRFDARRFWWSRYYWKHAGSVGTAMPGTRVEVEPVPQAEPGSGELVISGPNVMMGYYERGPETEEALRGGRLHSGDLGRVDSDGAIWITGRSKLAASTPGGEIVHLERVEAALSAAPEVAQVCVIEVREPAWKLMAVIFPSDAAAGGNGTTTGEAVEQSVRAAVLRECRRLRNHERLRDVTLTDEPLPVTRLGKIRRGSLPTSFQFDVERWQGEARRFAEGAV